MFLVPLFYPLLTTYPKDQNSLLFKSINDQYCLIYIKNSFIVCSYFIYSQEKLVSQCQTNFLALSSDLLFDLISQHEQLSNLISLSHALYIGKEVYKAELSKVLSQIYVQS